MRITRILKNLLGFDKSVVIVDWELHEQTKESRAELIVWVRPKFRRRGHCGRCGKLAAWEDNGGGQRSWRHIDVGFATSKLIALAPRVKCRTCGITVAKVPWARHDSAFTRAFEDTIVYDAIASSKAKAADRHSVSWRAVNNACIRVATEALSRVDLLADLSAIAIDEVKYKKGHKYLTVICNHDTGKVVWAAKGRSKETLQSFFDLLGKERSIALEIVTCDGAEWIHTTVAQYAPNATVCLDTFHVVKWATDAVDETRRAQWRTLRQTGSIESVKEVKGLRWLLLRNFENLSRSQRKQVRAIEKANISIHRAWRLKEELRDIFKKGIIAARRALDRWLIYASRSKLEHFVKLAQTIRRYRDKIEATIKLRYTNGLAESNNAAIGRIRSNARGFHDATSFITMVMLDRAGIAPDLPWSQAK